MLTVDLGRLSREGRLVVDESVPADAGLWDGLDFRFAGPVHAQLEVLPGGEGGVFVRGRVHAPLAQECRRCLAPLQRELDEELVLYYREDADPDSPEEGDAYPLPERGDLDLSVAMREQIILAVPVFPLCGEPCRGLCPQCGANRNESECGCSENAGDDRWAALKSVKFD